MNWARYEKLLQEREKDTLIILTEAEKHFRQALANHENAKRDLEAWNNGIEERMKGMNVNGIYTKQENDGTRDTIS